MRLEVVFTFDVGYFAKWQKDGVFAQLTGVLRRALW
jgi:hypothetical protein